MNEYGRTNIKNMNIYSIFEFYSCSLAGLEGLLVRAELGGRRQQFGPAAAAVGLRRAAGLVPAAAGRLPQQRRRAVPGGGGATGSERVARRRPAQTAGPARVFG